MKLYRINYTDRTDNAERCVWVGTQADSKAKYRELCELHDKFNVDKPVLAEVPTDKPGLLAWLNNERHVDLGD